MRANINRGARRFIGKADDEVLRRVARGRQSFASRELVDDVERAAFRRTVAFTRNALAIARARCHVGKERRSQRAKGCAVHGVLQDFAMIGAYARSPAYPEPVDALRVRQSALSTRLDLPPARGQRIDG